MTQLEALSRGARVRGVMGDRLVTVVDAKWFGQQAIELTYKIEETGQVGSRLVFRSDEPTLEVVEEGAHWAFDAPGDRFRLAMEATRIRLAYLFDPLLALSTSEVESLPHQISAVYETMLHRRPLRFLLADDHGGTAHQGVIAARRCGALPDRGAGQPRISVAGRVGAEVPVALRCGGPRRDRERGDKCIH